MTRQTAILNKTITTKQNTVKKTPTKRTVISQQYKHFGSRDARSYRIAEAAYLIAKQRGFQGHQAMGDWLQAEAEVEARFAAKH